MISLGKRGLVWAGARFLAENDLGYHGMCLAGARLAVHEYIDFTLTDDCLVHRILDGVFVDVVIAFLLVKSVVEDEFVVIDVPGDPVYL